MTDSGSDKIQKPEFDIGDRVLRMSGKEATVIDRNYFPESMREWHYRLNDRPDHWTWGFLLSPARKN